MNKCAVNHSKNNSHLHYSPYFCAMKGFDQQTLRDLEFNQIREWLVAYAIGPSAQKRLDQLIPSNDFADIEAQLLR